MRSRIVGVALTASIVAVVLFAAPLAVAVRQLFFSNEHGRLERAALQAVTVVSPEVDGGDPVELPPVESGISLALYDKNGKRLAGTGPPAADAAVRQALTGRPSEGQGGGDLVSVVPVSANERVIGAVRASSSSGALWRSIAATWAAMILLALVGVGLAVLVARRQALRLSDPLDSLSQAADVLGGGDFSVRTTRSGVLEIDRTAAAMDRTALRLGELVAREREFSANASHQLRTPLTRLRLHLESALGQSQQTLEEAATRAISSADELEHTISDLLSLTRGQDQTVGRIAGADELLRGLSATWRPVLAAQGRALTVRNDASAPRTTSSAVAVEQILQVLLDNATRHGAGPVEVVARDSGEVLAIDVRDQGSTGGMGHQVFARGYSGAGRSGIGLAFARDLAESRGGRLILTQTEPATVFTLLVPTAPADAA